MIAVTMIVVATMVVIAVIVPMIMVVPVAVVAAVIRPVWIRPVIRVAIAETEIEHRRGDDDGWLDVDRRRLDVSLSRRLDVYRRRGCHDHRGRRKRDANAKTHAGLGGRDSPE